MGPVGDVPTFRVSIVNKNSRTGFKIWVKIPVQASQKQIYPKGSPVILKLINYSCVQCPTGLLNFGHVHTPGYPVKHWNLGFTVFSSGI